MTGPHGVVCVWRSPLPRVVSQRCYESGSFLIFIRTSRVCLRCNGFASPVLPATLVAKRRAARVDLSASSSLSFGVVRFACSSLSFSSSLQVWVDDRWLVVGSTFQESWCLLDRAADLGVVLSHGSVVTEVFASVCEALLRCGLVLSFQSVV